MPFIDFAGLPWKPRRYLKQQIPEPWRDWLLDSGSLTQRLKLAFNNNFSVQVIRHGTFMPTYSEHRFLNNQERRRVTSVSHGETGFFRSNSCSKMATIREVLLICDGRPRVFARSVLPHSSLIGPNRELLQLGSKPLGEFLFNHPGMRRGPFEVAELPARQFNPYLMDKYSDETAWGRRSLFYLNEKPISVCEIFLPDLPAQTESTSEVVSRCLEHEL
ncbi:chorismate--pyruvate lyase family protein [Endozoicomonas numazuensis]|uniref:chorismate--pyruvate lyase family protein n=1 Tax=Endozoicomonas numazuensis TaxID=1137799 RepID=UPI00068FFF88|nr:chorismate lyase [Endozoicomonas numazuensis]